MYLPDRQREREREQERWNQAKRELLKSYEKKNECEERWISTFTKWTNGQRKKIEWQMRRQQCRAGHWKENRQIRKRGCEISEKKTLTRWTPGLARSTASARWRSYRTSNPERRPSLPSRYAVSLSSDHPHAGYGNLRDREMEKYLCFHLLPISHSLSAAWVLLLQTDFIYDSISALPAQGHESD